MQLSRQLQQITAAQPTGVQNLAQILQDTTTPARIQDTTTSSRIQEISEPDQHQVVTKPVQPTRLSEGTGTRSLSPVIRRNRSRKLSPMSKSFKKTLHVNNIYLY